MGWAPGDDVIVADAKVKLSLVRSSMYANMRDLGDLLKEIKHPEKGPALCKLYYDIQDNIAQIEIHLNR